MNTDELRRTLDGLIDRLCNGALSVPTFRDAYRRLQADHPAHEMSSYEASYYGQIQEELDWTVRNPDDHARRDGYIDEEQCRERVRELRSQFRSDDLSNPHLN